MTVDTLGLVLRVLANVGERSGGQKVLKRVKQSNQKISRLTTIWVDGGFDGKPFMQWVINFYDPHHGEAIGIKFDPSKLFKHPLTPKFASFLFSIPYI